MSNENIFYYDGKSARATDVRALVFNEAINVYDASNDDFIIAYPIRGTTASRTGNQVYIYLDASGTAYLQLNSDHHLSPLLINEVIEANDGWIRKLMRQKVIVLMAIMVALIAAFYLLLVTLVPVLGAAMINRQTEISMGNKLKQMMLHEETLMGSVEDTSRTIKLQAFANSIKLSDHYPIHVTVVKSKVVNAYALPGGQIVVYSGMLDKIEDAESLAALLAHEASHVNERHTLRSLLRSTANGLLVSIVFNDATGISATLVSNAETLRGLQYSRGIETEADEKGMELMIKNHLDPAGMKRLMIILDKEGDVPENVSFLSSHPLTKKRIQAAEAFIRKHSQAAKANEKIKSAFDGLKR